MRQFYTVTQKIKDTLISDANVNTVTFGSLADVDLAKQTIYPLAHIVPGAVSHQENIMVMDVQVFLLDVVDDTDDDLRDVADTFHGLDNLQDVYNTQLQVANRLIARMQRGDLHRDKFQAGNTSLNPFQDRMPNLTAGWVIDLSVTVPNNEICVVSSTAIDIDRPTTLAASAVGDNINLTWVDNSDNEDGFYVYRSTSFDNNYTRIATTADGATAYTDNSGVAKDTVYFYKVSAFNSDGESEFSNTVGALVPSGVCDDATATLGDGGDTILTITSGASGAITVSRGGTDITADSTTDGSGNIAVPSQTILNTANPIKTGQTTSYATGDDGDLQEGRLTDFTTLDFTNVFGNTNRFTDELGGQNYANDIVIDHSTYNQLDNTVTGLTRDLFFNETWADALTNANAFTRAGFTGWYLPNITELNHLTDWGKVVSGTSGVLDYPPLNITQSSGSSGNHWSSTTYATVSNLCWSIDITGRLQLSGKTTTKRRLNFRTFTWNGSALT